MVASNGQRRRQQAGSEAVRLLALQLVRQRGTLVASFHALPALLNLLVSLLAYYTVL